MLMPLPNVVSLSLNAVSIACPAQARHHPGQGSRRSVNTGARHSDKAPRAERGRGTAPGARIATRAQTSQRLGSNLQIGRRDLGPGAGVHFAARVKDDLAGDGAAHAG